MPYNFQQIVKTKVVPADINAFAISILERFGIEEAKILVEPIRKSKQFGTAKFDIEGTIVASAEFHYGCIKTVTIFNEIMGNVSRCTFEATYRNESCDFRRGETT
jgi:hypothetical protein